MHQCTNYGKLKDARTEGNWEIKTCTNFRKLANCSIQQHGDELENWGIGELAKMANDEFRELNQKIGKLVNWQKGRKLGNWEIGELAKKANVK